MLAHFVHWYLYHDKPFLPDLTVFCATMAMFVLLMAGQLALVQANLGDYTSNHLFFIASGGLVLLFGFLTGILMIFDPRLPKDSVPPSYETENQQ